MVKTQSPAEGQVQFLVGELRSPCHPVQPNIFKVKNFKRRFRIHEKLCHPSFERMQVEFDTMIRDL